MQKRVELGRALAMEPKLLLLDEPVGGMNVEETEDMARYILDIRDELDIPIVLVEHDMGLVMDLADRVMVVDFGRPVATGVPPRSSTTRRDPRLPGGGGTGMTLAPARIDTVTTIASRVRDRAAGDAARRRDAREAPRHLAGGHLVRLLGQALTVGARPAGARRRARRPGRGARRRTGPSGCYTDVATVAVRAMTVGLYPTNPAAEVGYLLSHSGARVLIAEDQEQVDKALEVIDHCPDLERIVYLEPRGIRHRYDHPALLAWDDLLALGREHRAAHPERGRRPDGRGRRRTTSPR